MFRAHVERARRPRARRSRRRARPRAAHRADVPGGRPGRLPPPRAHRGAARPAGPASKWSISRVRPRWRRAASTTGSRSRCSRSPASRSRSCRRWWCRRCRSSSASSTRRRAWVTWIATGFLLSSSVLTPILGKLGDSHGKKKMLVISLGDLRPRLARRRGGVEPAVADLLPRPPGRRRGRLPALVRDHPRRVPAREDRPRDRHGQLGVRRRRRHRARAQRRDHRAPELALAVPDRRRAGARPRRCCSRCSCPSRRSRPRRSRTTSAAPRCRSRSARC